MGDDSAVHIPDLLMGLAPAAGANCPRCGARTTALANGRGRLDFCAPCGTLEVESPEGLTLLRMRDLALRHVPVAAPAPPTLPRGFRQGIHP